MSASTYNQSMKVKRIKSYEFGYDVDAVKDVQDYVIDNYATEDYNIHIARGDDVMNHLTINRAADDQLDELIACCDGEGYFEE